MSNGKIARSRARNLRKAETTAEEMLWAKLRKRGLLNLKFLRQHPVFYKYNNKTKFFIADFYCHKYRLVIEVDGRVHDRQKDYDKIRTELINTKNINVIRFSNQEIYSNIENVLRKIEQHILPSP